MSSPGAPRREAADPGRTALPPGPSRPGLDALDGQSTRYAALLAALRTRWDAAQPEARDAPDDGSSNPAIALLDGWAVLGDVLGFYQERIADEGYLRTATERRSLLELARLIGHVCRPGVSASTWLAYTLQDLGGDTAVTLPAGSKAQGMPVDGAVPPTFETGEDLLGRASWSALRPQVDTPQVPRLDAPVVYLQGVTTTLAPNDPLLIVVGDQRRLRRVASVAVDLTARRITVILQDATGAPVPKDDDRAQRRRPLRGDTETLAQLALAPSKPPADAHRLAQRLADTMQPGTDVAPQLLSRLRPTLTTRLYDAMRRMTPATAPDSGVYLFRVHAAPFGANAPKASIVHGPNGRIESLEWQLVDPLTLPSERGTAERGASDRESDDGELARRIARPTETAGLIHLDNVYENIVAGPDSWVVIDRAPAIDQIEMPVITHIAAVRTVARADYGIAIKTTRIELGEQKAWLDPKTHRDAYAEVIRGSTVYARSEKQALADAPVTTSVAGASITLDGVVDGLTQGRWLIVAGERDDLGTLHGIRAAEVVMLLTAIQDDGTAAVPPERPRTRLQLATPLAYSYRPDSVTVHGNVVPATHGESRSEALGSGDARAVPREFSLRQSPLTHVAAATRDGTASSLRITVDGVSWREVDALDDAGPTDTVFITRPGAAGLTRVIFGDGRHGARLPAGVENVRADYRTGTGAAGNAGAESIKLLTTRPQGVKDVINPIAAGGGGEPAGTDDIRRTAGRGLGALDRLVSLADYADFAAAYAGVGQASAVRLHVGGRGVVHLTVAGAQGAVLDAAAPLLDSLRTSLQTFGDPGLPLLVQPAEVLYLVISAKVQVEADQRWETVEPRLRAALLTAFGFDRRALGRSVALSEVLGVMQAVAGVAGVDVDCFDRLRLATLDADMARVAGASPGRPRQTVVARGARLVSGAATPAQIAFLTADIPATLALTELQR